MNMASRGFAVVAVLCLCTFVTEAKKDAYKTFNKGRLPSKSGIIAEWARKMTTFSGKEIIAKEHAELVGENQILMFSEDSSLKDAYVYRSQSYHDYDTKPGILGVKYIPYGKMEGAACFIGETVKGFESTIKDIKPRDGKLINTCHNGKHHRVIKQVKYSGSKKIDEFCSNLPMYSMVQAKYQQGIFGIYDGPIKPVRVETICIFGPIDYWIPHDLEIPKVLEYFQI